MRKQKHFPGASLVEFALVFPLFIFLTTGFLDLGRAIFYFSSLTNAVRESTRYAIVHKDEINAAYTNPLNNSLQDKVLEYAFGLTTVPDSLTREDIVINVQRDVSGRFFETVSIEATYTYRPITPGIIELFGATDGIDIRVQSKMYVTPGSR